MSWLEDQFSGGDISQLFFAAIYRQNVELGHELLLRFADFNLNAVFDSEVIQHSWAAAAGNLNFVHSLCAFEESKSISALSTLGDWIRNRSESSSSPATMHQIPIPFWFISSNNCKAMYRSVDSHIRRQMLEYAAKTDRVFFIEWAKSVCEFDHNDWVVILRAAVVSVSKSVAFWVVNNVGAASNEMYSQLQPLSHALASRDMYEAYVQLSSMHGGVMPDLDGRMPWQSASPYSKCLAFELGVRGADAWLSAAKSVLNGKSPPASQLMCPVAGGEVVAHLLARDDCLALSDPFLVARLCDELPPTSVTGRLENWMAKNGALHSVSSLANEVPMLMSRMSGAEDRTPIEWLLQSCPNHVMKIFRILRFQEWDSNLLYKATRGAIRGDSLAVHMLLNTNVSKVTVLDELLLGDAIDYASSRYLWELCRFTS